MGKLLNNRQIELLKKNYYVDEENKVVDLKFSYDKCSSLYETSLGKYVFSNDVLESVNDVMEDIPFNYKVNLIFKINDYENYEKDKLLESFNDTLEKDYYKGRYKKQKRIIMSMILLITGILLLLFMVFIKNKFTFSSEFKEEVFLEVIDIAAWVFVWEAVSVLFLEYSESRLFAFKIKKRVTKVVFLDANENKVIEESSKKVFKSWEAEKFIRKIGKLLLVFSSTMIIVLAFYHFYFTVEETLKINDISSLKMVFIYLFLIINSIFSILIGIGGYNLYLGRNSKINKISSISVLLTVIELIISFIFYIVNPAINYQVSMLSSSFFYIIYAIGYYIEKHCN